MDDRIASALKDSRTLFEELDADGSGTLDEGEFEILMKRMFRTLEGGEVRLNRPDIGHLVLSGNLSSSCGQLSFILVLIFCEKWTSLLRSIRMVRARLTLTNLRAGRSSKGYRHQRLSSTARGASCGTHHR